MKALARLVLFLSVAFPVFSQNDTSVIGKVVDPDGQTWAYASWTWTLYNSAGGTPIFEDGTEVPTHAEGSLDVNGALHGEGVPNNAVIRPAGTEANITICSLTSAPCQTFRFSISGETFDMGAKLSALVSAPRMQGAALDFAYNETEILNAVQGNSYINTASNTCYLFSNGRWQPACDATANGPAGANEDNQININGAFGVDHGLFTYNNGTHMLYAQNQTLYGTFKEIMTNVSDPKGVTHHNTVPSSPPASGVDSFGTFDFNFSNSGFGKNIGNANGLTQYDQGWRSGFGPTITTACNASGICQAMHITMKGHATGDKAIIYVGDSNGMWAGGADAASDEGGGGVVLNGTQFRSWFHGAVDSTKGTGDTAPHFNGGPLVNGGFVMDTSHPVLVSSITGSTGLWESNEINIQTLPFSSGVVPSTGMGRVTTYIAASPQLGIPTPQPFSATVHDNRPLSNGLAWVVSPIHSEQCTLSSVVGSGTQTGSISCAYPHPVGSYIIQGGTHGCVTFDADAAKGNLTDFIAFGGADSTHILFGFQSSQGLNPVSIPVTGSMFADTTKNNGVHIYPCARVVSLQEDARTEILEQNDVPWAQSDIVSAPNPTAYHETMFAASSSQQSFSNPSVGNQGYLMAVDGPGASWSYTPFIFHNHYDGSNYAPHTNLQPPVPFWSVGAISNVLVFDDPIASNVAGSGLNQYCVGAILCDVNHGRLTDDKFLYVNHNNDRDFIKTERDRSQFEFGFNLLSPNVTASSTIKGSQVVAGTSGAFIAGNPGGGSYYGWTNNGNDRDTTRSGCIGSPSDPNMYCDIPAGGQFFWRIGSNSPTMLLSPTTLTVPGNLYVGGQAVCTMATGCPTGSTVGVVFGGNPNIISTTCLTAACTLARGTVEVKTSAAFHTGTLLTLNFATGSAPVCTFTQNGGATYFGIGNTIATSSTVSATVAVRAPQETIIVNYSCQP